RCGSPPGRGSAGCVCRRQTHCSGWRDGWKLAAYLRAARAARAPPPPPAGLPRRRKGISCRWLARECFPWACPLAGVRAGSRLFFSFGLEGLGGHFSVGHLQQNLDAAFGLLKLLLAVAGELDSFFKQLHGFVERKIGILQLFRHLFQARQGAFKLRLFGRLWFFAGCWVHCVAVLTSGTPDKNSWLVHLARFAGCGRHTAGRLLLRGHTREGFSPVPETTMPGLEKILRDRKSTRLNSSHGSNSYAVDCLKKKNPTSEAVPQTLFMT